jgi:curved DNA-binding protein
MGGGFAGFPGGFRVDFGGMGGAENIDFEELLSQMYGGGRIRDPGQRGATRPRGGHDIEGEIRVAFMDAIVGVTVPLRVDGASGGRTLDVRVPAGITDGGKLRLRGQGGPGTPPGDIVLTVHVDPNPRWERRERDLLHKLAVTALEAYGGATVGVETPWGRVDLKIPAGSQNGQSLRLRGKGVHGGNKPDGDLLVTLDVRLPPPGDEALLEALRRLQGEDDPRGA